MMTQRELRKTIVDILDSPLAEEADYIIVETVITRRYPTKHGCPSNAASYGIILESGRKEAYGQPTFPSSKASYSGTLGRQRA
jgi:hypothetical protein